MGGSKWTLEAEADQPQPKREEEEAGSCQEEEQGTTGQLLAEEQGGTRGGGVKGRLCSVFVLYLFNFPDKTWLLL